MYLKKVKLAGFKSFVDATTINIQSNLTGVVGPNGCGKSNIIDAVRWVMGEISAKQLRGESMSDVVFNGSATRKQVGQAAVELLFDNSDASLGGEYAKYQEISIRREVNRNDTSDYFLNNCRCRRKDITDVFLGTGLGARSYAIIEQGTISQLIDAKPDELRVIIEEAAGISKYKERRRETENRIKHTRENLARLNDIRSELESQLKHLKSQANAANRYKKLRQEERQTKAELLALHQHAITAELTSLEQKIKNQEIALEDKTTELHAFAAKIADGREKHHIYAENFNAIQEQYYKVGANIGRLEQQIRHNKNRQQELQSNLSHLQKSLLEAQDQQGKDHQQITEIVEEKARLEVDLVEVQKSATISEQKLHVIEAEMAALSQSTDAFNKNAAQTLQQVEVERTRILHLEQRISQETKTLEKLHQELQATDFSLLQNEIDKLRVDFSTISDEQDKLYANLAGKQQEILGLRDKTHAIAGVLNTSRNNLQSLTGKLASLEALQQTALGKDNIGINNWLKLNNLQNSLRLAQQLKVTPGWEIAIEMVLGVFLEGVRVANFEGIADSISQFSQGNLVLFDTEIPQTNLAEKQIKPTLATKVVSEWPITCFLQNIYIANNLYEALQLRNTLQPHESIITPEGIWLGLSWLRISNEVNPKSGILQRERELNEVIALIEQEKASCLEKENLLVNEQRNLATLEQSHHQLQQDLRGVAARLSEAQGLLSSKETRLEHLQHRIATVKQEMLQHEQNLAKTQAELQTTQVNLQQAQTKKSANEKDYTELAQNRDKLQQQLVESRKCTFAERQRVETLSMRIQFLSKQREYLSQNLGRLSKQLDELCGQQKNIQSLLQEAIAPALQFEQELQLELEKRIKIEAEVISAKQQLTEVDHAIIELEKQRSQITETVEQMRNAVEKDRTTRGGLQVRVTTYYEQIKELELQPEEIFSALPQNITLEEWEQKLAHICARIERLGPINLAAIEEAEKLEERKNYLDLQNQDLVSALGTLEGAISRIDQDTRELFRETFTAINAKLQELFPKVFNGGKSYLELTSENLLEAGVVVMAQPPGKRNSNIHLLSGGEKALTAISLIFSIFQLNPAPFCMLDEVDAPLDDLNVSRFCNLVKEMAKDIQFIFVTHNKLTMEIANQLVGITMQEPGVSRIVSVDLETAVAMAK